MAEAPDTAAPAAPRHLDLTVEPTRPTVGLVDPKGGPPVIFEMTLAEEMTFQEFADQQVLGKRIEELADDVLAEGNLEEMQQRIQTWVQLLLIDCPEHVAAAVNPGRFMQLASFFRELAGTGATVSENSSSSAPGSNDSTEEDQPAA
ncbi:MAG: hypothetical protein GY898_22995 [Proteobacteria bacterium]|nr:hypothetical protein [Pseudomonadota bacterium]